MVNNIKNNTISESDTKKKINELNEIKKVEIEIIENQKKLLSLFDDLKTVFNESEIENENENENESVNESVNENENESENENENKKSYQIEKLNNWFKTIDQTKSLNK